MLKFFPCYSLLWVPDIQPNCFNLHNTHQKCNYQTLFLYSEKKNNSKTTTGQKFCRGQKIRLTPEPCSWREELRSSVIFTTAPITAFLVIFGACERKEVYFLQQVWARLVEISEIGGEMQNWNCFHRKLRAK